MKGALAHQRASDRSGAACAGPGAGQLERPRLRAGVNNFDTFGAPTRDYAVPMVGDGCNFFRVRHARKIGIDRPRSVSRQAFALALASPPGPVGAVLDALTCNSKMTNPRAQGVLG